MIAVLKRYGMAFVFLLVVVVLMIVGTMGVMNFGDKILKETGIEKKQMIKRGDNVSK